MHSAWLALSLHDVTNNVNKNSVYAYHKTDYRKQGGRDKRLGEETLQGRPQEHRRRAGAERLPPRGAGTLRRNVAVDKRQVEGNRHINARRQTRRGRGGQGVCERQERGGQGHRGRNGQRCRSNEGSLAQHSQRALRRSARGQGRQRQRGCENGRAEHRAAREPAAPLGAGQEIRPYRLRPGREDYGRGLPRVQGQGRTPATRADKFLPRRGGQGRLHRDSAAHGC